MKQQIKILQNNVFCGIIHKNTTKKFKIVQSPLSLVVFGQGSNVGEHDMPNRIDLIGQKFGKLFVISYAGLDKNNCALWNCKCECGKEITVKSNSLRRGNTRSCGCLAIEVRKQNFRTHGQSYSRLYKIYDSMKSRCYNPTHKNYCHYGERGIIICQEWLNNFQNFYNWSINNGYSDDLTIDRINNNGNYEPNNCRWVVFKEQQNNRSNNYYISYKNKTQSLKKWCEELNLPYRRISSRLHTLHWSVEDAFEKPSCRRIK